MKSFYWEFCHAFYYHNEYTWGDMTERANELVKAILAR